MSTGVITALISGLVAFAVAVLSLFGARSAQRQTIKTQQAQIAAAATAEREQEDRHAATERAKFEAAAYDRARQSYERIVKDLEAQLERNQRTVQRVQDQVERVLDQLSNEQDVSNQLRNQMRAMQDQIHVLEQENERFRQSLAEHTRVATDLRDALRQVAPPALSVARAKSA